MAIFMTLLGKYSTHSHQQEGELWQGDKMEAVTYLGASGWQLRGQPLFRVGRTKAEPPVAELQPSTTVLHTLGLWRAVVNTNLSVALSDPYASWSTRACAVSPVLGTLAVVAAGWQASGKSNETFGLWGRKSGSFFWCSGGHATHASHPGQSSSKHREGVGRGMGVISLPGNKLKGDARRSGVALPYHASGTSMCLVSRYIRQIKASQEIVTFNNFAALWSARVL